jgi:hypothetical protein
MKKILKIDQNWYGIQKKERKYTLWKHGRRSLWKFLGTYTPNNDNIATKWTIKFKKKRKELSCLVKLLKVLEENKEWQLKGYVIFDLVNENNFNEMFIWKEFWKAIKFKKKRLKDFLMGRELI